MSILGAVGSAVGGGLGSAVVYVSANTTQLSAALQKGKAETAAATGVMGRSFGKAFGPAALGITAVAIAGIGAASVRSAMEAEEAMAQTTSTIKSMGLESKVTADQVVELSNSIAEVGGFDDEEIQGSVNKLLTFKNVIPVLDEAAMAAADLSVRFDKDLSSSAIMVGKALNDPVAGLTALSRVGVQFTQQQKDTVARLTEAGKAAQAQAVIMGELKRQVGGASEAFGGTLRGSMGKLKKDVEDLGESLGEALIPALQGVVQFLNNTVDGLKEFSTEAGELLSLTGIDTSELEGAEEAVAKVAEQFAKGKISAEAFNTQMDFLQGDLFEAGGSATSTELALQTLDDMLRTGKITAGQYQKAIQGGYGSLDKAQSVIRANVLGNSALSKSYDQITASVAAGETPLKQGVAELRALGKESGISKVETNALVAKLKSLPQHVTSKVDVNGAREAISQVNELKNVLNSVSGQAFNVAIDAILNVSKRTK